MHFKKMCHSALSSQLGIERAAISFERAGKYNNA